MGLLDTLASISQAHPFLVAAGVLVSAAVLTTIVEVRAHKRFTSQRVRAALPHGELIPVNDRVWHVGGTAYMMPFVKFGRSMIVVRNEAGDLTLLNAVRLSEEGERELLALGKIAHVITLNSVHGIDLPYYMDKFKPTLWAPPGKAEYLAGKGLKADRELRVGEELPFEDAHLFEINPASLRTKMCEFLVVLEREKALVSCDAFQNITDLAGATLLGSLMMRQMGFVVPHSIGPGWLMMAKATAKEAEKAVEAGEPRFALVAEFERLLADEDWENLLPGHGYASTNNTAREGLKACMRRTWPKWCK